MTNHAINYTALARFLNENCAEVTLFRFRELNLRNLLHYQAELAHLQEDLQLLEDRDAALYPDREKRANYRWDPTTGIRPPGQASVPAATAATAQGAGATAPPVQATISDAYMGKMKEIRETLSEYNQALEAYRRLDSLSSPAHSTIKQTRMWLDRTEYGAGFLSQSCEDVWDIEKPEQEFLTFTSQEGLSFRLASLWTSFRRNTSHSQEKGRLYTADGTEGGGIGQGIAIIVSSLLPVLPIVVLFFIPSLIARIGVILGFTAVFAGILVFGLRFSAETVLAVTTAIAAIQVVYVGSTAKGGV